MVKFILIKSPDEWATTKQACRDELVVYLSFSSIYTTLYFYVLSTVLRKSSFTLGGGLPSRPALPNSPGTVLALSCVSKAQGWGGCCFETLTAVRVCGLVK